MTFDCRILFCFGDRVWLVSAEIQFVFVFFRCTHLRGAIKHLLNSGPNQIFWKWLFFQNAIQVQLHGGKIPIVLYWEMKLQSDLHVSNEPAEASLQRSSQKSIAIDMLHKTPFNCVSGPSQRISASNPYGPPHMLYKCHICCLRITQHMKFLTQHMTKNLHNIWQKIRQHIWNS